MVAAFLIHLGILYNPCQAYQKLFCNSLNSVRIIALSVFIDTSILVFQMCQNAQWVFLGWAGCPLSFLNGIKLVALGLGGLSVV